MLWLLGCVWVGCDGGSAQSTGGSTGPSAGTSTDGSGEEGMPGGSSGTTGGTTAGPGMSSGPVETDGSGDTTSGTTTGEAESSSSSTTGDGSEDSSGGDPTIEPDNTIAPIAWLTPFAGRSPHDPARVLMWNGAATVVLNTGGSADLVAGEGLPSQLTVSTSDSSLVALMVLDPVTGAVTATQVLYESATPDVDEPYLSVHMSDAVVDASGALTVVGGWTGETTFFPSSPNVIERSSPAVGYVTIDGVPVIDSKFETAVLRLEPDGTAMWVQTSDASADTFPLEPHRDCSLGQFADGSPFVTMNFLSPGIQFPFGAPEPYVSSNGPFMARLDAMTGELAWWGSANSSYLDNVTDSVGGAVYTILDGANGPLPGTYFEGTPYSFTLPFGEHIARMDPEAGAQWVALVDHENFGGASVLTATPSGGVAQVGYSGGGLVTVEGTDGVEMTTTVAGVFHPRAQWFTFLDEQGTVLALEPIPEALRIRYQYQIEETPIADVAGVGGFWYGGYVFDLSWFDDGPTEAALLDDTPATLIHVREDGLVDETRVLGQGFDVDSMVWADETQTQLVITASYPCAPEVSPGLLRPGAPALEPLPLGCPSGSAETKRGFVALVDLGG